METDKISLNLKDNPEWQAALAGASPGDTVTLKEVTIMLDEIDPDVAVGSVEECEGITVTPGPDDEDDSGTGEASEEATAPVLSVMSPGYKKKK